MTREILFLIFICFHTNVLLCQTELHYGHNGKIYKCYTSLSAADSVNADSVYAIAISKKTVGIPKQILKYKNLQYLYLGSIAKVKDETKKLTKKEIIENKKRDSLTSKYSSCNEAREVRPRYTGYYVIKYIPEWISQLKKLEEINFIDAKIKKVKKYEKIFDYLPKVYIRPDTFDLNHFY
jgi:hypothetical protein